jgi:hypothetical protein
MLTPHDLRGIGIGPLALVFGAAAFLGACAAAAPPPSPTPAPIAVATPAPDPTLAPSPTFTATPAPSPSRSGPRPMPRGRLDPGTYVTDPSRGHSVRWQVTVPAGWTNGGNWFLYPTSLGLPEGPDGVAALFLYNPAVFIDDCDFADGMVETGTVAELVAAIRAKVGWDVSNPQDVTIGGFSGQRLDVDLPADDARCGEGKIAMAFGEPGTENGFFQQGPAQQLRVWVLAVDGRILGLVRTSFEASPADRVAEAKAILESSVITP